MVQAVKIVDEVSDDALLALTVSHVVYGVSPNAEDVRKGLELLNCLFFKIVHGELSISVDWLDHLEVLKAVRVSSIAGLNKFEEIYSKNLFGY